MNPIWASCSYPRGIKYIFFRHLRSWFFFYILKPALFTLLHVAFCSRFAALMQLVDPSCDVNVMEQECVTYVHSCLCVCARDKQTKRGPQETFRAAIFKHLSLINLSILFWFIQFRYIKGHKTVCSSQFFTFFCSDGPKKIQKDPKKFSLPSSYFRS